MSVPCNDVPYSDIPHGDKPLESLREESIDRLIVNYGHGKLSLQAFERRLDEALAASDHDTLFQLTADLDVQVSEAYLETKRKELGIDAVSESGVTQERVINILSSNGRQGEWTVPCEVQVYNILGDCKLDFTEARFTSEVVRIKVVCVLASIKVLLPRNVQVEDRLHNVLSDSRIKLPESEGASTRRFIIEGVNVLSSVKVKPKITMRERWLAFANSMRGPSG